MCEHVACSSAHIPNHIQSAAKVDQCSSVEAAPNHTQTHHMLWICTLVHNTSNMF